MTELYDQILASGPLDWLALIASLAYVWLAARDNNWCWLFAAISTSVWAWQSFVVYQLISDGFLQLFYLVMAGVGIWRWRRSKVGLKEQGTLRKDLLDDEVIKKPLTAIVRMTAAEHVYTILFGLIGGGAMYLFVSGVFTSAATLPDALTTAFSIATTFLLVWRRVENWLYWLVIDAVYVWIYLNTGAVLFALMMVINIGMALYGYIHWRQEMRSANTA
ncbi:nicotinamide mononucleotide transporter [Neolewinella aurantiaca]|uniref:Nicotinamide riboside transporter PnuC n=1 Tax=Neolewinella aurantiaca TaxID=2602767 RepID=A0A5C7FV37_9BACT|nr:nicotinamide riboside transporter PnuC [Neolewinella aurantiaca]TXF88717.1 nicotinamide mononucleotide transporter [Neolewinella aurantiaca]